MKEKEFASVCQAVQGGEERYVENRKSLYIGKVRGCLEDKVLVEAFDHQFSWPAEDCRESSRTKNRLGPQTSR